MKKILRTSLYATALALVGTVSADDTPTLWVGGTQYSNFRLAYDAASVDSPVTIQFDTATSSQITLMARAGSLLNNFDITRIQIRGVAGKVYRLDKQGSGLIVRNSAIDTSNEGYDYRSRVAVDDTTDPWATAFAGDIADEHFPEVTQGYGAKFRKEGSGVLELYGQNTYTAKTEVAQGTLRLAGTIDDSESLTVGGVSGVFGMATLELVGGADISSPVSICQNGEIVVRSPTEFQALSLSDGATITFSDELFVLSELSGLPSFAGPILDIQQNVTLPVSGRILLSLPTIDENTPAEFSYPLISGIPSGVDPDDFFEAQSRDGSADRYSLRVENGVLYAEEGTSSPRIWYVNPSLEVSGNGRSEATAFTEIWEAHDVAYSGDTIILMPGTYSAFEQESGVQYELVAGNYELLASRWNDGVNWDFLGWTISSQSVIRFRSENCGLIKVACNLPTGFDTTTNSFDMLHAIYDTPYVDDFGTLCVLTLAIYDEWTGDTMTVIFDSDNDEDDPFLTATLTNLDMSCYTYTDDEGDMHTLSLAVEGGDMDNGSTLTLKDTVSADVSFIDSDAVLVVDGGTVGLLEGVSFERGFQVKNGGTVFLKGPITVEDTAPSFAAGTTLAVSDATFHPDDPDDSYPAIDMGDLSKPRLPSTGVLTIELRGRLPRGSTNVLFTAFNASEIGRVALAQETPSNYSLAAVENEDGDMQLVLIRESSGGDLTAYTAWATANGLGAPDAVTDGEVNLVRYVFDRPSGAFSPFTSISRPSPNRVVIGLLPLINTTGVTVTMFSTTDPEDWSDADEREFTIGANGTVEFADDDEACFYRLKIE
ncbi:MAG: autotransporter-associated beta strand repeat-containing protein [Kiritimatiellae bacterium]|nr:autotransporter-associated beta strand repeat-containing protein [Kiritimatiellia bacterium]